MPNLSGVGRSGTKWTMTGGNVTKAGGISRRSWRLEGVNEVTAGINAALEKMKLKSAAGMVEAANIILDDADSGTSPLVPEDKGFLRASRFTTPRPKPGSGDPYVEFGYNKNYAAAVHEMTDDAIGKEVNWSRPGSGPKFLEASIARNTQIVIETIKKANI